MLQGSLLGQYNCVMVSQRPRKPFNNTLAAAVTQGVSLHLVILPHSFVGCGKIHHKNFSSRVKVLFQPHSCS